MDTSHVRRSSKLFAESPLLDGKFFGGDCAQPVARSALSVMLPRRHPSLRILPVELPNARHKVAVVTLKNRSLTPATKLFARSRSRWRSWCGAPLSREVEGLAQLALQPLSGCEQTLYGRRKPTRLTQPASSNRWARAAS
jgi:hypothetical protein